MATKKAASKGAKKSGAARKGSASKKGGASEKGAGKKGASKKAAAKKGGLKVAAASRGRCAGWSAVQDIRMLTPPTLSVKGKCTFPTHGYKVTLKESALQGINPFILMLEKIVTPPQGFVIPEPETIEVRFLKKSKTVYKQVFIAPGTVIQVKYLT